MSFEKIKGPTAKVIGVITVIIGALIVYYGYASLNSVNPILVGMYYAAGAIVILAGVLVLVARIGAGSPDRSTGGSGMEKKGKP